MYLYLSFPSCRLAIPLVVLCVGSRKRHILHPVCRSNQDIPLCICISLSHHAKGKVTPLRGRSLPLTTRATDVAPQVLGKPRAMLAERTSDYEFTLNVYRIRTSLFISVSLFPIMQASYTPICVECVVKQALHTAFYEFTLYVYVIWTSLYVSVSLFRIMQVLGKPRAMLAERASAVALPLVVLRVGSSNRHILYPVCRRNEDVPQYICISLFYHVGVGKTAGDAGGARVGLCHQTRRRRPEEQPL